MAQSIILNLGQAAILQKLGNMYGRGLSFSNVRISPTGGALVDWHTSTSALDKVDAALKLRCIDLEISREDLSAYLDWFDKQAIDEVELRSQFGTVRPRTESEKTLFTFLRLAQAFNYPQDIKRDQEEK